MSDSTRPSIPSPADALPFVRLEQVRKVYGSRLALGGIDLELRSGEISVLMGPNGAGKSTLLAILSTLSRPSSGQVHYGRLDHRQARRFLRHRIGLVAHAPLLYPHLTVSENLRFFARIYHLPDGLAPRRSLEMLGLLQVADRPVSQLSRGTIQRAALARALLLDPWLLLLDEPFSGLDAAATEQLRDALAAARRSDRITVVVTHDPAALDALADRLVVLDEGQVVAQVKSDGRLAANEIMARYRGALR